MVSEETAHVYKCVGKFCLYDIGKARQSIHYLICVFFLWHGTVLVMIYSLEYKNDLDITHEDTITSTIIGILLHLPDRLFWELLFKACYMNSALPKDPGDLKEFEFWPKWSADGTNNTSYVEPDVFIRFSEIDLIIEAKPSDEGGQYQAQWRQELKAYQNEYGDNKKPVSLIALGGNGSNTENWPCGSKDPVRIVTKCSWANLYRVLMEEQENLLGSDWRVVETLRLAFNLLGIRSYQWLDTKQWLACYKIQVPENYNKLLFRRQSNG